MSNRWAIVVRLAVRQGKPQTLRIRRHIVGAGAQRVQPGAIAGCDGRRYVAAPATPIESIGEDTRGSVDGSS